MFSTCAGDQSASFSQRRAFSVCGEQFVLSISSALRRFIAAWKRCGGGSFGGGHGSFFRCGFRIPHVVLFDEDSGLDGKRANCSGFGRGARKRPCIRHGLAVCFSWAAFRDLNAVFISGSKSGLRGERTYCGYPGMRTDFRAQKTVLKSGPRISRGVAPLNITQRSHTSRIQQKFGSKSARMLPNVEMTPPFCSIFLARKILEVRSASWPRDALQWLQKRQHR